jgi:uncharacterized protein YceH (UPF0502 family)
LAWEIFAPVRVATEHVPFAGTCVLMVMDEVVSRKPLAAVIGQDVSLIEQTLSLMISRRQIRTVSGDRLERFELII